MRLLWFAAASCAAGGYIGVLYQRVKLKRKLLCDTVHGTDEDDIIDAIKEEMTDQKVSDRCAPKVFASHKPLKEIPADFTDRCKHIMKHGYPNYDNLRCFQDFVLAFDRKNRIPHYVVEQLTTDNIRPLLCQKMKYLGQAIKEQVTEFREDERYFHDAAVKVTHDNYRFNLGGKYNPAPLADADNHQFCQSAMDETFCYTNTAPQNGEGLYQVQQKIRQKLLSSNNVTEMYVVTGPLFVPEYDHKGQKFVKILVFGSNEVSAPTHFFKVVLSIKAKGGYDYRCYKWKNEELPEEFDLEDYEVALEQIEQESGFLFFTEKILHPFKN